VSTLLGLSKLMLEVLFGRSPKRWLLACVIT
jgi:hypothetical protein